MGASFRTRHLGVANLQAVKVYRAPSYIWREHSSELYNATLRFNKESGTGSKWQDIGDDRNKSIYFLKANCLYEDCEELRRLIYLRDNGSYLCRSFGCFIARKYYWVKTSERLKKIEPKAFVDPIEAYRETECYDCQYEHLYWSRPRPCSSYGGGHSRTFEPDEGFSVTEGIANTHSIDFVCILVFEGNNFGQNTVGVMIFPLGRNRTLSRRLSM